MCWFGECLRACVSDLICSPTVRHAMQGVYARIPIPRPAQPFDEQEESTRQQQQASILAKKTANIAAMPKAPEPELPVPTLPVQVLSCHLRPSFTDPTMTWPARNSRPPHRRTGTMAPI